MDRSGSRSPPEPDRALERLSRRYRRWRAPPVRVGLFLIVGLSHWYDAGGVAAWVLLRRLRPSEVARCGPRRRLASLAPPRRTRFGTRGVALERPILGADLAPGHLALDLALGLDVPVDLLADLVRLGG